MRTLICCVMLLISWATASSQIDTTRKEFFPFHIGNLWQYQTEDFLLTGKVDRDTLIDGRLYYVFRWPLRTSGPGIARIDSLMRVELYGGAVGGGPCVIYKLAEPDNSVWPSCFSFWGLPALSPLVRFDGISLMSVFGQVREVMRFDFGGIVEGAPFDTILGFGALVARGIGVLHEQYYDGAYRILQGCIIDGVQYGTIVSVEELPETIPDKSSLAQNYPNPFNPTTTISYRLPAASQVTLKIYDVLGREVAALVNEQKSPGTYSVQWNAGVCASGVYFYRLQAGDFVQTRVLLLLK